jgi:hypothetical protein
MKQALVEGAVRIPGINLYEQGAGKVNILNSMVCKDPELNTFLNMLLWSMVCVVLVASCTRSVNTCD